MAKPVMIAKRSKPDWTVWYTTHDTDEHASMQVLGSVTIQDALNEAITALDASHRGWYIITKIEKDALPPDC
jgi:hypothetical protein